MTTSLHFRLALATRRTERLAGVEIILTHLTLMVESASTVRMARYKYFTLLGDRVRRIRCYLSPEFRSPIGNLCRMLVKSKLLAYAGLAIAVAIGGGLADQSEGQPAPQIGAQIAPWGFDLTGVDPKARPG